MSKKNWKQTRRKDSDGERTFENVSDAEKTNAEEKALLESTRAAMKALDERIKKYGYPPDFRH